jgi:preprotein translocase subunit SecA
VVSLSSIKHEESEEATFELLESESDPTLRTFLCIDLCNLFSERGIDVVKKEIESGYDTMLVSLEEELLPVAEVLGVELPDAAQWKQDRDAQEKRLADMLIGDEKWRENRQARIASGIDPTPRIASERPPAIKPPPLPQPNIRRTEPKVGRNDPCPCGSGKKYKKCCSRG